MGTKLRDLTKAYNLRSLARIGEVGEACGRNGEKRRY